MGRHVGRQGTRQPKPGQDSYGVRHQAQERSDSTLKGYRKEWFVDAWSRYLQTDGTTVTTDTETVLEPSNVPDVPLVPVKAGSGAEEEQEWNLQH